MTLFVAGIDHDPVDTGVWYRRIIKDAPGRRTFIEAFDLAGLPYPRTPKQIGEGFLGLFIAGIDLALVDTKAWYQRIFEDAPDRKRQRRPRPWR